MAEIDTNQLDPENILDVSGGVEGLTGEAALWPIEDQEVLIRGTVPPGAVQRLPEKPDMLE